MAATITALRGHVFVHSLEASLDAMGVVFDGAVSLASPLVASHAHALMYGDKVAAGSGDGNVFVSDLNV